MSDTSKKLAFRFNKEFNIKQINYRKICDVLLSQGFNIVFFNSLYNEDNVANLISALGLSDVIKDRKGFTYVDRNHRIVFVNEDLSEREKLLVLLHEEGHIYCGHFNEKNIIGRDVTQEYEANEFVHYVMNNSFSQRMGMSLNSHKKIVIIFTAAFVLLVIGIAVACNISKENTYYGDFYITQTGSKYHEEDCMYIKGKENVRRMTEEEYKSGEYEPCKGCRPDKD